MLSHLSSYVQPILAACVIFPFVAAVFTLPFMIVNYRRYGGIAIIRVIVVYSFILYSMCAFLLTVLPLPSREAVAAMPARPIGWIPGHDLMVGLRHAGFTGLSSLVDFAVWRKFLSSSDLFQILANIVMTIPLGFYLRYYFRCSWKKTCLIGLCVSLFYELTQLSGLFFIYPHNYRYTEVDDLINNTLGTMIGFWLTPLLQAILPTRDEIDRISRDKGRRLTVVRRVFAILLDVLGWTALTVLIGSIFDALNEKYTALMTLVLWLVYFCVLPLLTGGRLPGHLLLKLRIVSRENAGKPAFWQLLIRYLTLWVVEPMAGYLSVFAVAGAILYALTDELQGLFSWMLISLCLLFTGAVVSWFWLTYRKWHCLPHSSLSRTYVRRENE